MKLSVFSFLTIAGLLQSAAYAQYNPTSSDTTRRELDLRWRGGAIPMAKDTASITTIYGSSQVQGDQASSIMGLTGHYEAIWTTGKRNSDGSNGFGFAVTPNITVSIQGKKYKVMELTRLEVDGKLITLFTANKVAQNVGNPEVRRLEEEIEKCRTDYMAGCENAENTEKTIKNLEKELEVARNAPAGPNRVWGTADIAFGEVGGVLKNLHDVRYFKAGASGTIVKGSFHVKGELNETIKLEVSSTGRIGELQVAYREKDNVALGTNATWHASIDATIGIGIGPVRVLNYFFVNGAFNVNEMVIGNTTSINIMLGGKKKGKTSAEISLGLTKKRETYLGSTVDSSYIGLGVTVRH